MRNIDFRLRKYNNYGPEPYTIIYQKEIRFHDN